MLLHISLCSAFLRNILYYCQNKCHNVFDRITRIIKLSAVDLRWTWAHRPSVATV